MPENVECWNSRVEIRVPRLKFRPHGYICYSILSQLLAALVSRVVVGKIISQINNHCSLFDPPYSNNLAHSRSNDKKLLPSLSTLKFYNQYCGWISTWRNHFPISTFPLHAEAPIYFCTFVKFTRVSKQLDKPLSHNYLTYPGSKKVVPNVNLDKKDYARLL